MREVRPNDGKNFDICTSSEKVREIYVDGAEIMFGIPVSKIQFHSTVGLEEEDGILTEQREIKTRVVIPTHVLLKLSLNILANIKENGQGFSDNIENYKKQFIDITEKISFNEDKDEEKEE